MLKNYYRKHKNKRLNKDELKDSKIRKMFTKNFYVNIIITCVSILCLSKYFLLYRWPSQIYKIYLKNMHFVAVFEFNYK